MAKGKGKSSSSDNKDQAPPRLLRSRKREFPNEDILQTPTVPTDLKQQQFETDGPSSLTEQDQYKKENGAVETYVPVKGHALTNVTSPSSVSNLQGCAENTIDDSIHCHSTSGVVEKTPLRPMTCQSNADHTQAFLLTSEMVDGSGATGLEWQPSPKENSQRSLEGDSETSKEEPCNGYTDDAKEFTKETAVELPPPKKRRMGMCGMTEKERSHFLESQRRENGQSGAESGEKQIYNHNTEDVAKENTTSALFNPTTAHSMEEQSEAEIKLTSSHCGETERAATEGHIVVTTCEGAGTVRDPGSPEEEKGEAKGGPKWEPEQTAEPKSTPPAQGGTQENLVSHQQRELRENTTGVTSNTSENQKENGDDRSPKANGTPVISFHTDATEKEEYGTEREGIESAPLPVAEAKNGTEAEGTSSFVTEPEGFNCGSVEICGGALTPTASESQDRREPRGEPVPRTPNLELARCRDASDGAGCLDFVSDSQLNTIVLSDERTAKEKNPGCIDCSEDATDLISGLIRELSTLNQKVMTTHRELENLRRSTKTSRSSLR